MWEQNAGKEWRWVQTERSVTGCCFFVKNYPDQNQVFVYTSSNKGSVMYLNLQLVPLNSIQEGFHGFFYDYF
jgi:hypothetical protein